MEDIFTGTPEEIEKLVGKQQSLAEILKTASEQKKTQTPAPKVEAQTPTGDGKYAGFDAEEIARYFDKDGNPTDRLNEASHSQLVSLVDNRHVPLLARTIANQIIMRRNEEAAGLKRFSKPSAEEIEERKLQRYLEARQETRYPFTWELDDNPVLFDESSNRYWMRTNGYGDWVPCTAFGLDPKIQQKGQRRKVLFAGPVAGYHEGSWAISKDIDVLVTEEKDPIISIDPEFSDAEKTWQFLLRALGKDQFSIFEEWLVRAADPDCLWDHILVLVGDPVTGQLIQKIILKAGGSEWLALAVSLTVNTDQRSLD